MTTRDQNFDYRSYSVLERKDAEWLREEVQKQTHLVAPTVVRRTEDYESKTASYCAIGKDRAHYLDFVTAGDFDPMTIPDMKSVSGHYPRFGPEVGDEAVVKKLASSDPSRARLFRYPDLGFLGEKNYVVGYEGRLVTAIVEIGEPLADRIEKTLTNKVQVHDYRMKGYSDYRLTPCYLRGQYKTHHLIWQEMGFFSIGAPYAKRILGIKNVRLTSKDELIAEKAVLCRILEKKRFPQDIAPPLEKTIRAAAGLDCGADTKRFLSMFSPNSTKQSFVKIRKLYDRE
jgi:hypothetical protein